MHGKGGVKLKKQWIYIIIALVVVLAVGIAIQRNNGGGKEIKIGGNFELTGAVASFGQSTRDGFKLGIEQANESGALGDKKIKLIEVDNKSDNAEATNMATKLITQDKVVAVVGPVISSNAKAAGEVAQSNKVPLLSPTATALDVTAVGEYVFRACFLDELQAKAMAQFAYNTLKLRKAAILSDSGDSYSTGLAQYFKQYFTQLGGKIVSEEHFLKGDAEFRPQLTKIKGAKADSIYIPAYYSEDGNIARQAREMGITVPLLGVDGWDSSELAGIAGAKNLNNVYFTNHYTPADQDPAVQAFVTSYKEKYGKTPDALAALGFEAAGMLVDAINRAEKPTPENIRDALATVSNLKVLRAAITVGPDRNLIKDVVIVELKNGEQVLRESVSMQ